MQGLRASLPLLLLLRLLRHTADAAICYRLWFGSAAILWQLLLLLLLPVVRPSLPLFLLSGSSPRGALSFTTTPSKVLCVFVAAAAARAAVIGCMGSTNATRRREGRVG